ncbi:MAG: helix-turn-helix transcriptional regulator [Clostridiales bacterium]|nr:helix-turn-helix transcriptional regulator [Clostridiales bacterium]
MLEWLRLVPDEIAGTGHLIRSILLYLDQHYLEPVTMGEPAGVFGYNRSYLSRVFGAYVQTGFHPYVNRLRARHAARLIQTTEASMGQIAEASGFASVRSFNRAFAELYQITPMAYRKHRQEPTDQGREIDRLFQVFSYLPPEKHSPAAAPLSAREQEPAAQASGLGLAGRRRVGRSSPTGGQALAPDCPGRTSAVFFPGRAAFAAAHTGCT